MPGMARGTRMGGGNGCGEPCCDRQIQFPARGKLIERLIIVKPAGMNRPFDDLARCAAEAKPLGGPADRQNFEIDVGRVRMIDADFVLAGGAALFERRKIHEGIIDRALDLVGVGAREKHHGAVGVYALDRFFF